MRKCIDCGSMAINPHIHGREPGIDLDLCDVCYWRKRAKVPFITIPGDIEKLLSWVVSRWDAEVKHRPSQNVHRRTLDDTWRQVYRKISNGKELPR